MKLIFTVDKTLKVWEFLHDSDDKLPRLNEHVKIEDTEYQIIKMVWDLNNGVIKYEIL